MRVAILGTGIMGAGMARSASRAGHDVVAWNRTAEKAAPLADDGIAVAVSVREAVSDADVVVTMLFDTDAVLAVSAELTAALGDGAVWVQSSTVGPDGARRIGAVSDRVLDAPVVGTKKPAEEGTLSVLVSGPEQLIATAQPVLDAIGAKTVVVGPEIGQASALKLACNAWIGVITAGTAQSLALAQTLGVDPGLFLQTIDGAPVDSPYAQLKGKAMLQQDWTLSFAVDGVVKDVGLMIDAASESFPTSLLEAVRGLFRAAADAGHGGDDMAAVRTAFPA